MELNSCDLDTWDVDIHSSISRTHLSRSSGLAPRLLQETRKRETIKSHVEIGEGEATLGLGRADSNSWRFLGN